MEERSNKTIISSVLFLDIVEYSKKSVSGQISLKDRFNTYLSEAIRDVPVADRIILDTGDGAAVSFIVDVEAAIRAALRLRASLLEEDPYIEPPLLVRIGINLGPVRLVRDINGQPNIVGDGINVAQRVMAFADASQILVSRSYYDAVSRLSPEYTGMFHYQGSRTDKHVREHEVYAIGYPGDQTTKRMAAQQELESEGEATMLDHARTMLFSPVAKPGTWSEKVKQASTKQRAVYAGMAIVPLLLLAAMLGSMQSKPVSETPAKVAVETMPVAASAATAVEVMPKKEETAPKKELKTDTANGKTAAEKTVADKAASDKAAADKAKDKHKPDVQGKKPVTKVAGSKPTENEKVVSNQNVTPDAEPPRDTRLAVHCKEGTQVFVDGSQKGKMSSESLVLNIKPGKHKVILTHPSFGLYNEEIDADAGKTERIKPKVCN